MTWLQVYKLQIRIEFNFLSVQEKDKHRLGWLYEECIAKDCHTHHFTEVDETIRKVVFKVKSRGALCPAMRISERKVLEEIDGRSPSLPNESANDPDVAGTSRATNPLSAFSYQKQ